MKITILTVGKLGRMVEAQLAMDYAAEFFSLGIHDPQSARSAAKYIALDIHFHAIGRARLGAA